MAMLTAPDIGTTIQMVMETTCICIMAITTIIKNNYY